jgi:hypothetical protein
MIKKWFKKREEQRNRKIALEVCSQLGNMGRGWERFLPPVVVRDMVYMVTENGSIYRMQTDGAFETITQIQVRP